MVCAAITRPVSATSRRIFTVPDSLARWEAKGYVALQFLFSGAAGVSIRENFGTYGFSTGTVCAHAQYVSRATLQQTRFLLRENKDMMSEIE